MDTCTVYFIDNRRLQPDGLETLVSSLKFDRTPSVVQVELGELVCLYKKVRGLLDFTTSHNLFTNFYKQLCRLYKSQDLPLPTCLVIVGTEDLFQELDVFVRLLEEKKIKCRYVRAGGVQ